MSVIKYLTSSSKYASRLDLTREMAITSLFLAHEHLRWLILRPQLTLALMVCKFDSPVNRGFSIIRYFLPNPGRILASKEQNDRASPRGVGSSWLVKIMAGQLVSALHVNLRFYLFSVPAIQSCL